MTSISTTTNSSTTTTTTSQQSSSPEIVVSRSISSKLTRENTEPFPEPKSPRSPRGEDGKKVEFSVGSMLRV